MLQLVDVRDLTQPNTFHIFDDLPQARAFVRGTPPLTFAQPLLRDWAPHIFNRSTIIDHRQETF